MWKSIFQACPTGPGDPAAVRLFGAAQSPDQETGSGFFARIHAIAMLLAVATINDRSLEKINTRIRVDGGGSERPSPGKLQARADAVGMASVIFEEGVEVPPDLVVEIVSDTSVEKDTVRLPQAYHAAGVREFWL